MTFVSSAVELRQAEIPICSHHWIECSLSILPRPHYLPEAFVTEMCYVQNCNMSLNTLSALATTYMSHLL
jgi:hypothetical protein